MKLEGWIKTGFWSYWKNIWSDGLSGSVRCMYDWDQEAGGLIPAMSGNSLL